MASGLIVGATVPAATRRLHPLPPPSRKTRTALILGCSEATADKKLWGAHAVNIESAKVIEADLRAGDYEAVAGFLAPIDAALAGYTEVPVVDALFDSQQADTAEDSVEAAYHRAPSVETARALIKASALERMRAERREAALKREWGL